jgi:hypothetical protein
LREGLDATELKLFSKGGKVTDSRSLVNFSERRAYCELIARMKEVLPPIPKEVDLHERRPVIFNIQYIDSDGNVVDGPLSGPRTIQVPEPSVARLS